MKKSISLEYTKGTSLFFLAVFDFRVFHIVTRHTGNI